MKIYIGADHNGFEYKNKLAAVLKRSGHEVIDEGGLGDNPEDDFPQYAGKVVTALLGEVDRDAKGILICGSGQGMAMAANRFKGIRAALCWNLAEARSARNDDDANVLCLSSRYLEIEDTTAIVSTFMSTQFAGASRFKRRLDELDQLG
jgi:ribose 5-phosphate isomerase B